MGIGVSKTTIVFRLDGERRTLDFQRVPFRAWPELKKATGFTQSSLIQAMAQSDVEAAVALVWLQRVQRDRKLRYVEVYQEYEDNDSAVDLELLELHSDGKKIRLADDDEDDAPDEEESDPTGRAV